MNNPETTQAQQYFLSLGNALDGLDTYLQDVQSPAHQHQMIASTVDEYLDRLRNSLRSWENRVSFQNKFRVSQTESGFPAYQNVLDLQSDRATAEDKLDAMKTDDELRQDMVEHILSKRSFPADIQAQLAERVYLQDVQNGKHFSPLVLPKTVKVSVNPKSGRPYYVVHWGYYDGSANLPMIYMATIEDSSEDIRKILVSPTGKLNKEVNIKLPVGGLLNPDLALKFDEFCEKNSSYSLMPTTIATNLDHDFDHLHPKQLRRFVLGPFYHAAFTRHGEKVDQILARVRDPANAWLMTWTLQEVYSVNEQPAKWGLWSNQPAREEFFIDTNDLDSVRMGVSDYQRHAIVPHEAYQAIYASGEQNEIFGGYQTHVISDGHVLRNM